MCVCILVFAACTVRLAYIVCIWVYVLVLFVYVHTYLSICIYSYIRLVICIRIYRFGFGVHSQGETNLVVVKSWSEAGLDTERQLHAASHAARKARRALLVLGLRALGVRVQGLQGLSWPM